ncbi:peroxide stress protein YaaA [Intestinimonas massiliensis (ex Afouda et al. 2020)]|nr:peroxide stress protein YaaA [Intestinimonas massiliensis (ex Afouda et al. 2020)]
MAPHVFTAPQLDYVREHLHILSGFYGLLQPFDGVRPYRLEMQA